MINESNINNLEKSRGSYDINWEINIWVIFLGLLIVFGFLSIDVFSHYFGWYSFSHNIAELLSVVSLLGLIIYLIILLLRARITAHEWKTRATYAEGEAQKWKEESKEILRGLGNAIDRQFEEWKMTNVEKEIGLFILKGFSFKEIADFRSVSERTVRQQATSIYKKSGLGSRNEFSAFFLEDLLLPLK